MGSCNFFEELNPLHHLQYCQCRNQYTVILQSSTNMPRYALYISLRVTRHGCNASRVKRVTIRHTYKFSHLESKTLWYEEQFETLPMWRFTWRHICNTSRAVTYVTCHVMSTCNASRYIFAESLCIFNHTATSPFANSVMKLIAINILIIFMTWICWIVNGINAAVASVTIRIVDRTRPIVVKTRLADWICKSWIP